MKNKKYCLPKHLGVSDLSIGDKIEYYNQAKEKLNNTPAQYKTEFEWLKEADSLALANAQMNLQDAYAAVNIRNEGMRIALA